jgi:hypothetical protein
MALGPKPKDIIRVDLKDALAKHREQLEDMATRAGRMGADDAIYLGRAYDGYDEVQRQSRHKRRY